MSDQEATKEFVVPSKEKCVTENQNESTDTNDVRGETEIKLVDEDSRRKLFHENFEEHNRHGHSENVNTLEALENSLNVGWDMEYSAAQEMSEHENEIKNLKKTLEDNYQSQILKISDELRQHYQQSMEEKTAKLEDDWELEFQKQKFQFEEQISAVQREQWTQCQDAIEKVTSDAEDQLKNMKHAYERETAEHKQRIKELLEREALWEIKEKEMMSDKKQKENESLEKIKSLENELTKERQEKERELTQAKDEIKTLTKHHEGEIESLTKEFEKKYTEIVQEMRKVLKEKYQEEMDRKVNHIQSYLREQYEQDLQKTKEEIQESTRTLKIKYEKEMTEILNQLEDLHNRNQQHELEEAKLKDNYDNEMKKVAEMHAEIDQKKQIIHNFERNQKDLKTKKELEDLEKKFRLVLEEKHGLEEKIKEIREHKKNEVTELKQELKENFQTINEKQKLEEHETKFPAIQQEKNQLEQQLRKSDEENKNRVNEITKDEDKNVEKCKEQKDVEGKIERTTKEKEFEVEKQVFERKLKDKSSEIALLKKIITEKEKKIDDITSKYDNDVIALENEKRENFEEVCRLEEDLAKHKATILELQETSQARELEIANLILSSSRRNENVDENLDETTEKLEQEIRKYMKKVQELEEEAENKVEATCSNCINRNEKDEILHQSKLSLLKMEQEHEKIVQELSTGLKNTQERLHKQIEENKSLSEKLSEAENEIHEERQRSLEISKLSRMLNMKNNEKAERKMKNHEGIKIEELHGKEDKEQFSGLYSLNEYKAVTKIGKKGEMILGTYKDKCTYIDTDTKSERNNDLQRSFEDQEEYYRDGIAKNSVRTRRSMDIKECNEKHWMTYDSEEKWRDSPPGQKSTSDVLPEPIRFFDKETMESRNNVSFNEDRMVLNDEGKKGTYEDESEHDNSSEYELQRSQSTNEENFICESQDIRNTDIENWSEGYKEIRKIEIDTEISQQELNLDFLLERKENERLRSEVEILNQCVDEFQKECEWLRKNLDKTFDMVKKLQEERETLIREQTNILAEHSEVIMDLIKNEDIISTLRKRNERLEKNTLQDYPDHNQTRGKKISVLRNSNSAKTMNDVLEKEYQRTHDLHEVEQEKGFDETKNDEISDSPRKIFPEHSNCKNISTPRKTWRKSPSKSSAKNNNGSTSQELRKISPKKYSHIPKKILTKSTKQEISKPSSQSFLTSIDPLVPNLSGISPIISTLDRLHYEENMKWKRSTELSGDIKEAFDAGEKTGFLIGADPVRFIETSVRITYERHQRSKSSDDSLLQSPRERLQRTTFGKLHIRTPIMINFEDYVFRHQVKSSDSIADLRDPSPAELWFS